MAEMMRAAVFVEPGRIELADKPIPDVGPNDALIRITTTTICGTDVHILKGEYPVAPGLTVGHEPVGVIEKLGSAVKGYREGQRVIAGAICPNFNSYAAQDGVPSQDGSYLTADGRCGCHGYKATAGWRFGNLIDGTQAEYVLVPDAEANLAPIPDGLTDEQVLMCPDIMSTGFKGAENANIRIGDTVVVFAQGPIGLCATAGARLLGATTIIAVDGNDHRLDIARQMGADVTLNFRNCDVVDEVMRLTGGRGADASIEALGTQTTFAQALKVLKPGGTLSSLGVYSEDLVLPLDAFAAGLGDHRINTALCPGGKERMRRLMNVVASNRLDLGVLVTHEYALDDIVAGDQYAQIQPVRRHHVHQPAHAFLATRAQCGIDPVVAQTGGEGIQRQHQILGVDPQTGQGATGLEHLERLGEGRLGAQRFDRGIGAAASGQPHDLVDHIAVAEVQRDIGAHLPGDIQPVVVAVHGNDGGCPEQPGTGGGAQANRPLGEDHHGIADADVGILRTLESGGHDVRAHQHLLVGQTIGNRRQVGLGIGHQHVLGLGTV